MEDPLEINEEKYHIALKEETEGFESLEEIASKIIKNDNPLSLNFPNQINQKIILSMKLENLELKDQILLSVIHTINEDLTNSKKNLILFEPCLENNDIDKINKTKSLNIYNAINREIHIILHGKKNLEKKNCIFLTEPDINTYELSILKNSLYDKKICNLKETNKIFEFIAIKTLMISFTNYMNELIDSYMQNFENENNNEEIYIGIYKDFVKKSNICSELEEALEYSLGSFKNKYQMNFTLSELFTDIFWNSIFHNKSLCKLFIDTYSNINDIEKKINIEKIRKVIFGMNIPLKHHIIDLLGLRHIEQDEKNDLMTLIAEMKNEYHYKIMKLEKAIKFKNGKKRYSEIGNIPVYGGNGILGYTNNYNAKKNNIIIGRVGAYCGCVYKNDDKCWISDNAIVGNVKEGYDYTELNSYSFVSGLCFFIIFWGKMTVAAPIIAVVLTLIIDFARRSEWDKIVRAAKYFIFGGVAVSAPILVYFISRGALSDMVKCVFILGFKRGTDIYESYSLAWEKKLLICPLCLIFALLLWTKKKAAFYKKILMTIMPLVIYALLHLGTPFDYYFIIELPVLITFLTFLPELTTKLKRRKKYIVKAAVSAIIFLVILILYIPEAQTKYEENSYIFDNDDGVSKVDAIWETDAQINENEKDDIFNLESGMIYYEVLQTLPLNKYAVNCPYFLHLFPEIKTEILLKLEHDKPKWIISEDMNSFDDADIRDYVFRNYVLVDKNEAEELYWRVK